MADEENLVAKSQELMTTIPARIREFMTSNNIAFTGGQDGAIKFGGENNKTISFEAMRPDTLIRPGIWLKFNDGKRAVESPEQLESILKMDTTRAFFGLPKLEQTHVASSEQTPVTARTV